MSVAVTATTQDVWPPRIQVTASGLTLGADVELYREVAGQRTLLRAGTDPAVTDTSVIRVDAEAPFGAPITYVAVVNGIEYASAPTTVSLPGGRVALSDAITGLAAEVTIVSWSAKAYAVQSTTFQVGGRNVVVMGAPSSGATSTMDVLVEDGDAADDLRALLAGATEGIVQVRQPGGYTDVDCYVAVTGRTEGRLTQRAASPRRVFSLTLVEVEPWAQVLEARGFTYADVETATTGLTYAQVQAQYATYLAAMLADWSA